MLLNGMKTVVTPNIWIMYLIIFYKRTLASQKQLKKVPDLDLVKRFETRHGYLDQSTHNFICIKIRKNKVIASLFIAPLKVNMLY